MKNMQKISSDRFYGMFEKRGIGITEFANGMQEEYGISDRTIYDNLKKERMSLPNLNSCAEKLHCNPKYLTGEYNEPAFDWRKSPYMFPLDLVNEWEKRTDKNGMDVGTYEDKELEDSFDAFAKWFEVSKQFFYFDTEEGVYSLNNYIEDYKAFSRDYRIPGYSEADLSLYDFWQYAVDGIVNAMKDFHDNYMLKKENPKEYYRRVRIIRERRKRDLKEIEKATKKEMKDHDKEDQ